MNLRLSLCTLALLATAFGAQAQTIKPGLWEISSKTGSDNPEMAKAMAKMQEQMAAMPPEKRKMMEEMMAKQGVSMSADHGGVAIKVCITADMVKNNDFSHHNQSNPNPNCTHTMSPRVGNTSKVKFECSKPPSSGEGEMTFESPQSYTTKMTLNSTRQGKAQQMTVESHGKWLSDDCGSVKPYTRPASKAQ